MDCSRLPDFTACQYRQFHLRYRHHPLPHHHHYYHVLSYCPLHGYMLHFADCHSPRCPISAFSHPQSQNHPETTLSSNPPPTTLNFQVSGSIPSQNPTQTVGGVAHKEDKELEEEEHQQLYEEEDEEQDPVFVLTNEWKEFFATSEAKRILAKKQSRREGKTRIEQ